MADQKRGVMPVEVVPTTRAKTTTILGAISVYGVVQIAVRKPNQQSKKRGLGQDQGKKTGTGTNTNHYIGCLISLMGELDKFSEMKGSYLVMDNAPIHMSERIDKLAEITRLSLCVSAILFLRAQFF